MLNGLFLLCFPQFWLKRYPKASLRALHTQNSGFKTFGIPLEGSLGEGCAVSLEWEEARSYGGGHLLPLELRESGLPWLPESLMWALASGGLCGPGSDSRLAEKEEVAWAEQVGCQSAFLLDKENSPGQPLWQHLKSYAIRPGW